MSARRGLVKCTDERRLDSKLRAKVDEIYRSESRRVLATLIRLLGDFDLAEEALHDAFRVGGRAMAARGRAGQSAGVAGLGRPLQGDRRHPAPRPVRRSLEDVAEQARCRSPTDAGGGRREHRGRPAAADLHLLPSRRSPPDAQVALTLREVCGLTTEEIASAFLTGAPTLAQRIVRAKAKIRDARIPYQVPSRADLPERLDTVLHVIYLVFNEGYSASSGASLTRPDLSGEAIRLGRLLVELLPEPEVVGLLALMLLQESRRARADFAGRRAGPAGRPGPLAVEPRADRRRRWRWSSGRSRRGGSGRTRCRRRSRRCMPRRRRRRPPTGRRSSGCTTCCCAVEPSPVVELNRAVAVAMRDGPAAGLALIDAILARGELADYHLAHAARADLCRRLGRIAEARASYERALALARQEPERRFLERRLAELS